MSNSKRFAIHNLIFGVSKYLKTVSEGFRRSPPLDLVTFCSMNHADTFCPFSHPLKPVQRSQEIGCALDFQHYPRLALLKSCVMCIYLYTRASSNTLKRVPLALAKIPCVGWITCVTSLDSFAFAPSFRSL